MCKPSFYPPLKLGFLPAACEADIPGALSMHALQLAFPHHVALTRGTVGSALQEAFERYLGLEVFPHGLQPLLP